MDIRAIRTVADYEWALQEVERYFEHQPAAMSREADRYHVLTVLIEAYKARHVPIEVPAPLEVVRLHMEQNHLMLADLARVLGSRSRASEFLAGDRDLTLIMVRAIRSAWGISADLLIPHRGAAR